MANVFISYAREDEDTALEIYRMLEGEGFNVWLDKKNLMPGQDWKTEIEKAIKDSAVFIACLSSSSVNKTGFVQAELKRALDVADLMPEEKIFIIPLRLNDCPVPYKLQNLQWLDYFDSNSKGKLIMAISRKVKAEKERQPISFTPAELRRKMDKMYDLESLQVLCLDLGVRFENLPSRGVSAKIVDLIEYCKRHNKYEQLVREVLKSES
jgi:TIR domain/Effector-associated domain 7